MLFQTYLMSVPIIQKCSAKYDKPLIKYFQNYVPARHIIKWVSLPDTTVEDLAAYYIGVLCYDAGGFVALLCNLSRNNRFETPDVYAILTPGFWDAWQLKNFAVLIDARENFKMGIMP